MADNVDKDKQNDTQLESDNNDKPTADADKPVMDTADDHKEVDDDPQDVKSSDLVRFDVWSLSSLFCGLLHLFYRYKNFLLNFNINRNYNLIFV